MKASESACTIYSDNSSTAHSALMLHHHYHNETQEIAVVGLLLCKLKRTVHRWAELLYWILVGTNVFFQPRWAGERKPAKLSVNHIKRKFCFPGEKSHSQSRVLSVWAGKGVGRERLHNPVNRLRLLRLCSASKMLDPIASASQFSKLGQSQFGSIKCVHFFKMESKKCEPSLLREGIKISHGTSD